MTGRGRGCTSELPSCCCGRAAIRLSRFTVRQFMCHGQTKIAQKTARVEGVEKKGEGDKERVSRRVSSRGRRKEKSRERRSVHAAYSTVRYPAQFTSLQSQKSSSCSFFKLVLFIIPHLPHCHCSTTKFALNYARRPFTSFFCLLPPLCPSPATTCKCVLATTAASMTPKTSGR